MVKYRNAGNNVYLIYLKQICSMITSTILYTLIFFLLIGWVRKKLLSDWPITSVTANFQSDITHKLVYLETRHLNINYTAQKLLLFGTVILCETMNIHA